MEDKIILTYCPNNPEKHDTRLYERLAEDDRFELRSPYCRKLCTQICDPGLYAFIGEGLVGDPLVRGSDETEFLNELERATGFDLTEYRTEL